MKKNKKSLGLRIFIIVFIALFALIIGYVIYVFASFTRIGDQALTVEKNAAARTADELSPGNEYRIASWNIGFGAYEDDYGFFMDGGTESWAWSKERLDENLKEITKKLKSYDADLYIIQEVDFDGTRSYHTDEREFLKAGFPNFDCIFSQNYDSPFLMYPVTQPHGANKSCIMTFSRFPMTSARRVELPIENSVTKVLDLDRCYSVSYIPTSSGNDLALFNLHLSAYTSDGTIATEQLKLLLSDMEAEYKKGNYCIAGGDFNKDILGDSSVYFGKSDIEYTWAQPIPAGTFDSFDITLVKPIDESAPVPSCRNADSAYHQGQYVLTVDGFMVSENVEVTYANVIDEGFKYSDHNPVEMRFKLK